MVARAGRGSLLQDIISTNRWWSDPNWEATDPQLRAARQAPYSRQSSVLDDVVAPNLYTLRGPRRVGKSTVLKQTIARLIQSGVDPRRLCYFSADALGTYRDLINLFQAARQLFPDLGDAPRYFFIDEISMVKEWQRGIKWLRDNTALAQDCVVASGSSARDIADGAVYLAGRRGPDIRLDRLLLPMSFPEFARCAGYPLPPSPKLSLDTLYTFEGRAAFQDTLLHMDSLVLAFEAYLLAGGFPQAVTDFRRTATVSPAFARDLWDVVQADLHRQGVSRPEQVLVLLEQIGKGITSTVSVQKLANELGIDRRTAAAWTEALASAYLVLLVHKENGGVPDIKSQRKVYPIDPLIARLSAYHSPGSYEPDTTQLAEAVAALAIFRSIEGHAVDRFHQPSRVFYYRSASNTEIDFLVLPGQLAAESKYIDTPDRREVRSMLANFGDGILLTRSGVDLASPGPIVPISVFTWLLDQGD